MLCICKVCIVFVWWKGKKCRSHYGGWICAPAKKIASDCSPALRNEYWAANAMHHNNKAHCSTAMSTRPAWHSGFFAWFILLWPRHDHFSSQIKMKGGAFWKTNHFVVTEPNLWIILWNQFLLILLQSKVLSIKLWPRLKFWHWSLWCWAPISNDIDLLLVTWKFHG